MRKVSDHMRLVKREAGANPARTRHRDSQATAYYHWETGKGVEASERSVGRPAFRSTGMKSYRSPATFANTASSTLSAASQLIFAYKTVRVNGNNENSCHEKLAVRNLQNQKHFWFYFVALRDSKLWLRSMELIQRSNFAHFAFLLFFQRHLNENFPYHSFIAIFTHCWDKILLSSDTGLPDARRFCNPNPFPRRNL